MQKTTLRKRDLYLNRIIAFQDTEMIKVMTGIRRCGKSSLMKLMAEHLRDTGVTDDQIIEMNFESMSIPDMDARGFYEYVKARICPNKRTYLFFDEVQKVRGWENAVNSFRVDFDCDIYITGSNAYLLSSELSTYLSGPPYGTWMQDTQQRISDAMGKAGRVFAQHCDECGKRKGKQPCE